MINRKKISKRKLVKATTQMFTSQETYKAVATAALIELNRASPDNRLLKDNALCKQILAEYRKRIVRAWKLDLSITAVVALCIGASVGFLIWGVA